MKFPPRDDVPEWSNSELMSGGLVSLAFWGKVHRSIRIDGGFWMGGMTWKSISTNSKWDSPPLQQNPYALQLGSCLSLLFMDHSALRISCFSFVFQWDSSFALPYTLCSVFLLCC